MWAEEREGLISAIGELSNDLEWLNGAIPPGGWGVNGLFLQVVGV